MRTVTVQPNQSMMDVILQGTGSMGAAIQFCVDNDVSITEIPVPGTVYNVSDAAILQAGSKGAEVRKGILKYGVVFGTLGELRPPVLMNDDGNLLLNDDGQNLFSDQY